MNASHPDTAQSIHIILHTHFRTELEQPQHPPCHSQPQRMRRRKGTSPRRHIGSRYRNMLILQNRFEKCNTISPISSCLDVSNVQTKSVVPTKSILYNEADPTDEKFPIPLYGTRCTKDLLDDSVLVDPVEEDHMRLPDRKLKSCFQTTQAFMR